MENKILIVDDEINILELLRYNLDSNGYKVYEAKTGEEAIEIIKNEKIDLVVLDHMLPGMNGIEVLSYIRKSDKSRLPVIMLTAKNEEIDAVVGLEMGADDYIGKPFRIREFISRVKTVLRRSRMETSENSNLLLEDIRLNTETYKVYKDNKEIVLTLKEFELLAKLMKNPGIVFTREDLLESIWGYDYIGETRTVDVHIRQLRVKIENDDKYPILIQTVRGIGYRFKGRN